MTEFNLIQKIFLWGIPVLFAITVHEVSHGWVASKLGDPTAKMLGRLTLNPIKHIDPIGTILVPALLLLLGGFVFGWAKPVPITWANLKKPRRDITLVALAGPGSNLLMAFFWAFIVKLGILIIPSNPSLGQTVAAMGGAGISINMVLMILNLIPLPPLDGSRVVTACLPRKMGYYYNGLERYGFWILLILLATGLLSKLMLPPLQFAQNIIRSLFGF